MRFSILGLAAGRAAWKQGTKEEGDDTAAVEPI